MLCSYLGVLVLKKILGVSRGVGVGTQPLSSLMEEKLRDPVVRTGLITMKGDLKLSCDDDSEEVNLSEPIEHFKNGDLGLILGHPESWLTNTARDIIEALRKEEMIVFSFIDEFQMNLSNHWGKDFR